MKSTIYFVSILITILLSACRSSYKSLQEEFQENRYSPKNALNWAGTYRGTVPCNGCEGIQKTLTLDSAFNYQLSIRYIGKENSELKFSGIFYWNEQGNIITLIESDDLATSYFVVDNALAQVDVNGNRMKADAAKQYVLSKDKYALVDKYWRLIELNGERLPADIISSERPHIFLSDESGELQGSVGCKELAGKYKLTAVNNIAFSQTSSNFSNCGNKELQSNFLKALQSADSFIIQDDILILSRAGIITLARFKALPEPGVPVAGKD
ncbi:MAG TPA: copper resistance protein NlpE N-terminal domain-containing protein [Chitinophagaceae bacterium]